MTGLRRVHMFPVLAALIVGMPTLLAESAIAAGNGPAGLQSLIDAAEAGDVVRLTPGTYDGGITIDRPLTLVGEGWPVIDGHGEGSVVTVAAPDVTIRGVVIANSGKRLDRENAGRGSWRIYETTRKDALWRGLLSPEGTPDSRARSRRPGA